MTVERDRDRDEAWLRERLGPTVEPMIARSRAAWSETSEEERRRRLALLEEIETDLAGAMARGVDAADPALDPLLDRHRGWIGLSWGGRPRAEAYGGLADLYEAHPDFVARYEARAAGFTRWLAEAMRAYAQRTSG